MDKLLTNTLGSLQEEFQANELAFLALTTKIELPLRDRWAFRLFRELSDTHVVAREWKRTDVAILKGGIPTALIELKAMYTFDAALDQSGIAGFCDAMERDAEKAHALANASTSVFTVLLATHPKQAIAPQFERIVKYRQGINQALNKYGSEEEVALLAVNAVNVRLKKKNVIAHGALPCGEIYKIPTEVFYWLVKA